MTNAIITREYKGNVFKFREDGYFNMTDAAKKFGKELKKFWGSADLFDRSPQASCGMLKN